MARTAAEPGDEPFALVTRRMVKAVRDELARQPRTAQKVKEAISSMYSWAEEEELVEEGYNSGKGFKKPNAKVNSYVAWSDEELELVLDSAYPSLRTLILLAAYTGQRSGDVIRFNWSQVHGNMIRCKQEKTGAELMIPCHPRLRAHLDALRSTGSGTGVVVLNAWGRPFCKSGFRGSLYDLMKRMPNMPRRTPHGLRYTAAAKLEAAGCTVAQIVAVLGHHTYKMALQYLTQRHDAEAAIRALDAFEKRSEVPDDE